MRPLLVRPPPVRLAQTLSLQPVAPLAFKWNPATPVTLADGLEYVWNENNVAMWMEWRNPANKSSTAFNWLAHCGSGVKTWRCGDVTLSAKFWCAVSQANAKKNNSTHS